jgi:hypothetical protein
MVQVVQNPKHPAAAEKKKCDGESMTTEKA